MDVGVLACAMAAGKAGWQASWASRIECKKYQQQKNNSNHSATNNNNNNFNIYDD